jgi:hypothetical protein
MRRLAITLPLIALALAGVAQAKVPQGNWPAIDGATWVNSKDRSGVHHGSDRNDKLLGGHGDDVVYGHRGSDVIWGDYKASGNTTRQHDVLRGGGGHDWIYASTAATGSWPALGATRCASGSAAGTSTAAPAATSST